MNFKGIGLQIVQFLLRHARLAQEGLLRRELAFLLQPGQQRPDGILLFLVGVVGQVKTAASDIARLDENVARQLSLDVEAPVLRVRNHIIAVDCSSQRRADTAQQAGGAAGDRLQSAGERIAQKVGGSNTVGGRDELRGAAEAGIRIETLGLP